MGLIKRGSGKKREAAAQQEAAGLLQDRAFRLVDTHGVVLGAAEAELQEAVAGLRAYGTPEREQRVADAQRRVAEAKRLLEEAGNGRPVVRPDIRREPAPPPVVEERIPEF